MEEDSSGESASHRNSKEAAVVVAHVLRLIACGLAPEDIGVITPYNGQVEALRGLLLEPCPRVEVRTVDGFQGGEKEGTS